MGLCAVDVVIVVRKREDTLPEARYLWLEQEGSSVLHSLRLIQNNKRNPYYPDPE